MFIKLRKVLLIALFLNIVGCGIFTDFFSPYSSYKSQEQKKQEEIEREEKKKEEEEKEKERERIASLVNTDEIKRHLFLQLIEERDPVYARKLHSYEKEKRDKILDGGMHVLNYRLNLGFDLSQKEDIVSGSLSFFRIDGGTINFIEYHKFTYNIKTKIFNTTLKQRHGWIEI